MKVLHVNPETGNTCYVYVGPRGQNCAEIGPCARLHAFIGWKKILRVNAETGNIKLTE